MSVSRRFFIKAGTLAAIAAGISIKPGLVSLAQDLVNPGADPLANYTRATFVQYLNSIFTLRGPRVVEVTLMKVEDTLSTQVSRAGGRESFSLFFVGGSVPLPQDTYTVEHPALGSFRLFVVPSGADENGAQGYLAVINRLAYTAKPTVPGGRKPLGRKRAIVPDDPEQQPLGQPEQQPEAVPEPPPAPKPVKPAKKVDRKPEGIEKLEIDY